MNKMSELHHRRSIRLKGYDYSKAGLYFITIVTQDMACLFGDIKNGKMILNDGGRIAHKSWMEIPDHFPNTKLDEFVIMPNHVHGIIQIIENNMGNMDSGMVGAKNFSPQQSQQFPQEKISSSKRDGENIAGTKDISPHPENIPSPQLQKNRDKKNFSPKFKSPSKTIGSILRGFKIGVTKWFRQNRPGFAVWQRDYWDHIIRNEIELNRIRQYIINNPLKWNDDRYSK
jgi:REP element-mobilizing transposase RayT